MLRGFGQRYTTGVLEVNPLMTFAVAVLPSQFIDLNVGNFLEPLAYSGRSSVRTSNVYHSLNFVMILGAPFFVLKTASSSLLRSNKAKGKGQRQMQGTKANTKDKGKGKGQRAKAKAKANGKGKGQRQRQKVKAGDKGEDRRQRQGTKAKAKGK